MSSPVFTGKLELAAIPPVAALAAWLVPRDGLVIEPGELIAGGALLLLFQGFFRDLWRLRQARREAAAIPAHEARCLCVESAVGLTGILAGIGLVGLGHGRTLLIGAPSLAVDVGGVMAAGYLLKDFVFEWSPWKIYRAADHARVVFRWRQ